MDAIVQRLWQIREWQKIETLDNTDLWKDLFLTTLNNYSAIESDSTLQSIKAIEQSIKSTKKQFKEDNNVSPYSCKLTTDHIITILANDQNFLNLLYIYGNSALSKTVEYTHDIRESCEEVLHCLQVLEPSQHITDNSREMATCHDAVFSSFMNNKTLQTSTASIPLANNNDNIFIDGRADNWPFDLMIDIETSKKLLFEEGDSWPQTPEMIYYSLPYVPFPGLGGISLPQENQNWELSPESNNSDWSNSTSSSNNWTTEGRERSDLENEIVNFVINKQKRNVSSSHQTPWAQDTAPAITNINNTICIDEEFDEVAMPEIESNESIFDPEDLTKDPIEEYREIEKEIIDTLSWFLYKPENVGGSNYSSRWKTSPQWPNIDPVFDNTCNSSCSNEEWIERSICQGNCCMSTCSQLWSASDKAICLSQCLCGSASVPNDSDILRVTICREPVPIAQIQPKRILSVEEGVDEINKILIKLKEGGAMIKRTKKKDLFDSSFSNVKLHEIFAIDIFVSKKPIYDVPQLEVVQRDALDKFVVMADFNQTTWSLETQKDRNKYVISGQYRDDDLIMKDCIAQWKNYNTATKRCEPRPTWEESKKRTSALVQNTMNAKNDSLYEFFSEQYQFRDEIYKQFVTIRIITKDMSEKARLAR